MVSPLKKGANIFNHRIKINLTYYFYGTCNVFVKPNDKRALRRRDYSSCGIQCTVIR